ncbi:response regulator [Ferrovibrio sp.]|uniref:response regulator n=1 Tax=Ferrovibrio sp. TaxID=1917215 RepID=UPI001B726CFA|nr:response regulator [Ferrovibrio sp.]MBP7065285.1 response regulator [Ferrovibrio sp.]
MMMRSIGKPDSKTRPGSQPAARPGAEKFRTCSVLVVDENRATRNGLRDVLIGMGFSAVFQAADGKQALLEVAAHEPSLILVDYRLPKMDGLMFTERLRRDPGLNNNAMPVILMAADVDSTLVVAARDAGVNEVVVKPISMQVLVRRLLYALQAQRPLVRGGGYVGPDRRRRSERRLGDRRGNAGQEADPDRRQSESRRRAERRKLPVQTLAEAC